MNTEVVSIKSFEDRLMDKIKKNIGNILTQEDLNKIVTKGIDDTFFQPRPNPNKSYSDNSPPTIPPLINEIVLAALQTQVKLAVEVYLKENYIVINKIVENTLQQGAGTAIMAAVTQLFQGHMFNMQTNITDQLRKG